MAAIYSLYIINKSGGLIFYKDYGSAGRMDTNDSLRLASLWHSMHAISQQLSPISGCSGIELLEADTFDLHCFQSLTGESGKLYQGFKGTKGKLYATVVTRSRYQALNIQFVEHCNFSFEAVAEPEISPGGGLCGMGAIDVEQAVYEDDASFGTKFFVVCEPGTQHMEGLLRYIYELYTDFVLKNPFYEMEMPIRCELFDINLVQAVQKDRVALLGR